MYTQDEGYSILKDPIPIIQKRFLNQKQKNYAVNKIDALELNYKILIVFPHI